MRDAHMGQGAAAREEASRPRASVRSERLTPTLTTVPLKSGTPAADVVKEPVKGGPP